MTLLLALIAISVFIGYRAERMDRRHYLVLLGFISIAVIAQLASFYISPPQQLFIPYDQRTFHSLDDPGVNP